MSHKEKHSPWRRRLEDRIKATWRKVSQPSKQQEGTIQQTVHTRGTGDCQTKADRSNYPSESVHRRGRYQENKEDILQ